MGGSAAEGFELEVAPDDDPKVAVAQQPEEDQSDSSMPRPELGEQRQEHLLML